MRCHAMRHTKNSCPSTPSSFFALRAAHHTDASGSKNVAVHALTRGGMIWQPTCTAHYMLHHAWKAPPRPHSPHVPHALVRRVLAPHDAHQLGLEAATGRALQAGACMHGARASVESESASPKAACLITRLMVHAAPLHPSAGRACVCAVPHTVPRRT